MQNDKNNAKLKKVLPECSPGLGKNKGLCLDWRRGVIISHCCGGGDSGILHTQYEH